VTASESTWRSQVRAR